MFPENFRIRGSLVPSFALYWGLILGFWISFRYLWKISSILQFVLYSLALLRFLTIQFFCTLWLFDKYKMQDPVQKSVVFPERVKSCNLYMVTGLYSLSILKESKSQRVKSCNPYFSLRFENLCFETEFELWKVSVWSIVPIFLAFWFLARNEKF